MPATGLEHSLDDRLNVLAPRLARVAHRGREVVGADGDPVDPGHAADRVDLIDTRDVFEERVDERLLVGTPDVLGGREPE
jgi:hypothetical protein